MKVDMLMPVMGESIAEATILRWLKQPGDLVYQDEMILEVATDKVDTEIPAPASGSLERLLCREGDVVPVGGRLAVIETETEAAAEPSEEQLREEPYTEQPVFEPQVEQEETEVAASFAVPVGGTERIEKPAGGRFYSPLVKSLAAKYQISLQELDEIEGSGQGGRVTKQDLMLHLEKRGKLEAVTAAAPQGARPEALRPSSTQSIDRAEPQKDQAVRQPGAQPPTTLDEFVTRADDETIAPMDSMRRAIAEHMVLSKRTSPHAYAIHQVDMTNAAKWREQHGAEFEEKEGFPLSFTHFFMEAAVKALLAYPYVNSSLDGSTVHLKRHINLGCTLALEPAGLIVPVIKRAEEKNFTGLARSLQDLVSRARSKQLLPDDVAGGTFTITNPGVFGTLIGTPIINQPQAAILCIGTVEKRPVVIDDMIAIRRMCYLTLSYDHRILDSATSGRFLSFIRNYLENWDMNRGI